MDVIRFSFRQGKSFRHHGQAVVLLVDSGMAREKNRNEENLGQ